MPIVNRLLDAFFRTLDAVDTARERLDRALGRAPKPEQWATEWSPTPPAERRPATVAPIREAPPATHTEKQDADRRPEGASRVGDPHPALPVRGRGWRQPLQENLEPPKDKGAPKRIRTAGRPGATAKKAKPAKQGAPKRASRKGSVDRKGTDFDSPRARAVADRLASEHTQVVSGEAAHDGKKVLARVLWALDAAERAGSELGLTAADASALLSLAAGLEVFATNVARACRDETALIVESTPDGRSKRYKLTAAGRAAAGKLELRTP